MGDKNIVMNNEQNIKKLFKNLSEKHLNLMIVMQQIRL